MSWLSEIFSSSAGAIVDSVGKAADALITSDEERLQLKNELVKIQLEATLKANEQANEAEAQITERWKSDNEHWLTRLVRPGMVVWSFTLLTLVIIADGNIGQFKVQAAYIPLLSEIVIACVVAYMGVRSFDKHSRNKYKGG